MDFPLKKGSKGQLVTGLQNWLNLAAEAFNVKERLDVDGKFGNDTIKFLNLAFPGTNEVSEKLYRLMIDNVKYLKDRIKWSKENNKPTPDDLLRRVVAADQKTFENLLLIYARWETSTPAQRKKNEKYYNAAFNSAARLINRAKKLSTANQKIVFSRGFPASLQPLVDRYTNRQLKGIGEPVTLTILAVVAISCLIVGAIATAVVVDWLTPAYSESTSDFKQTDEVRKILDKLDPKDKEVLVKEVEQQIDQANVVGQREGKVGGTWGTIKTIIIIGGLGLAYFTFAPKVKAARQ